MLTARARAKLLPASKALSRVSVAVGKKTFLAKPHFRPRARFTFRMFVSGDMKGAVNNKASDLFALTYPEVLRIATRNVRTDVDVADRWHTGRITSHAKRDHVGWSSMPEVLSVQLLDCCFSYERDGDHRVTYSFFLESRFNEMANSFRRNTWPAHRGRDFCHDATRRHSL